MPTINPESDSPFIFIEKKEKIFRSKMKELKKAENRILERLEILQECQNWKVIEHLGQLLQANLFQIQKGDSQISVLDWESNTERLITLDPLTIPHEQAAAYFKKAKKLRKGEIHAERLLKLVQDAAIEIKRQIDLLNSIETLETLESYSQTYEKKPQPPVKQYKKPVPAKPYNIYRSETGTEIWVGKSAKNNDILSFQCANGSDWWLHAADYPGSHVVIRTLKGIEPDVDTLNDAAELSLRFSQSKDLKGGDVSLTQVKWIKQVKGIPGRVMLTKHKTLRIKLDNQRWNRLRSKHPEV